MTLRKVSCWPANAAPGRSSAVALERTATGPSPRQEISGSARTSSAGARPAGRTWSIGGPPVGYDSGLRRARGKRPRVQYQTPARNESERDSAGQTDEPAEQDGEVQHRGLSRGWRWDGGNG